MIQSKFNTGSYAIVYCLILLTVLLVAVLYFFPANNYINVALLILIVLLIAGIFVWLVYGELRTKALRIRLDENTITVTNNFGFGKQKVFYFLEFQGYRTIKKWNEYQSYEYLNLVAGDRNVIKLSEFYHKNYEELKAAIFTKVTNLDEADFDDTDFDDEAFDET